MKKPSFFLLSLFLMRVMLHANSFEVYRKGLFQKYYVNTQEYCDFLNESSTEKAETFYDEKMEHHPQELLLLHVGKSLRYSVHPGKGQVSIPYVSWLVMKQYASWREQEGIYTLEAPYCDVAIKSNQLFFCFIKESQATQKKSQEAFKISTLEEILEGTALLSVLLSGAGKGNFEKESFSSILKENTDCEELAAEKCIAGLKLDQAKKNMDRAAREETEISASLSSEEESNYRELTLSDEKEMLLREMDQKALFAYLKSDHLKKRSLFLLAQANQAITSLRLHLKKEPQNQTDFSSIQSLGDTLLGTKAELNYLMELADHELTARDILYKRVKKASEVTFNANITQKELPEIPSIGTFLWQEVLSALQEAEEAWKEVMEHAEIQIERNFPFSEEIKKAWNQDFKDYKEQHFLWQERVKEWKNGSKILPSEPK